MTLISLPISYRLTEHQSDWLVNPPPFPHHPTWTIFLSAQGIYFAKNALRGDSHLFAGQPGSHHTFLCRVAVGEFCQGRNGQTAPDERNLRTGQPYDSTTDSMDEEREVSK